MNRDGTEELITNQKIEKSPTAGGEDVFLQPRISCLAVAFITEKSRIEVLGIFRTGFREIRNSCHGEYRNYNNIKEARKPNWIIVS
jgi:hypothetical protein